MTLCGSSDRAARSTEGDSARCSRFTCNWGLLLFVILQNPNLLQLQAGACMQVKGRVQQLQKILKEGDTDDPPQEAAVPPAVCQGVSRGRFPLANVCYQ